MGHGPKLSEADVQRACTDLLIADHWRGLRMEHAIEYSLDGKVRRKVGEVSMPDYLYLRYWAGYRTGAVRDIEGHADLLVEAQVLWIEYKAPGKRPSKEQRLWHRNERNRGALVWVVDDIDQFKRDYAASGLARNVR
jgi:hypothetical protein